MRAALIPQYFSSDHNLESQIVLADNFFNLSRYVKQYEERTEDLRTSMVKCPFIEMLDGDIIFKVRNETK